MALSYQSDTSPMYVGRFSKPKPLWLTSQASGTWAEIPMASKLSDIDPKNDPLINPDFPSNPPWRANVGQKAIMSAWCGACYDQDNDVLYFPLNGGHSDYAGNEPYKIDISDDNPLPVILRNPTGAIGNEGSLNDGQESTGVYFDGRPRAIHSYNKNVFVPNVGAFIAVQGSTSFSGQSGTSDTLKIDVNTGESTRYGAPLNPGSTSSSGADYDKSRDCIWYRGAGTTQINKYDVATNTWSVFGGVTALSGGVSLTYIDGHDVIFIANNTTSNGFVVFDCVTGDYYEPAISGSFIGYSLNVGSQFRHVDSEDYIAVWDNSSDTTIINTITIPQNPRVDDWVIGQLPVSGSNTVSPTTRQPNGTFGRFFYSKNFNGFGVINNVDENIYFFKV